MFSPKVVVKFSGYCKYLHYRQFNVVTHLSDWIRSNTPRKEKLLKLDKPLTILEKEFIKPKVDHIQLTPSEEALALNVQEAVDTSINQNLSRYFAVIYLAGKQFKVTTDDLIMIKSPFFGTEVGDHVRLEKTMLVGSNDFTLIGRPLLSNSQVFIEAKVCEKTLEHPKLWFQFHKRRRHRKMRGMNFKNFNLSVLVFQDNLTILKITNIQVFPTDQWT